MQRQNFVRRNLPLFVSLVLGLTLGLQLFNTPLVKADTPASRKSDLNPRAAQTLTDDWTTYGYDNNHSNYNSAETTLTASNVTTLQQKWSQYAGGGVAVQPIIANGTVYWGSWDGNEHAFTTAGAHIWDTQIGTTTHANCLPTTAGTDSTGVISTIGTTPVLFVGGGDSKFYALNANTGAVIWSTTLGTLNEDFLWGSPTLYNGSIYIGIASFGDCPLTQGRLFKIDTTTGNVQGTFYTVPSGCVGGGIWGTPTISSGGMLYVATGTYNNSCAAGEPLAAAVLKIQTSDLSLVGSWQLPLSEIQNADVEFGSAPTLMDFPASNTYLIGVAAKDGYYYALNRSNISAGPVWKRQIATDVNDCPQCGSGSISPSAWDGTAIYAAGGQTTIAGATCAGSVRALSPLTGAIIWEHCLNSGPVLGSVTEIPGVVIVTQGTWMNMMNTQTGATIFTFNDTNTGSTFYGPASVARGQVFVGNMDGNLYCFGL